MDGSFFPGSGAVNPALTIAAQALRVVDHLLGSASHLGVVKDVLIDSFFD
jgi:choline dehydrogenase-like flavoprotein